MSPVELSPAPTSSTLWAQPSKEWVIPARPKPGRKPKKGLTASPIDPQDDADEESSASRRVQNRAAQRAFRERKQTQLAELQARLHSYEQGEIERNVALQTIAKKTKEENEELRKENQMLREKITRMEQERDEFLNTKRAYDDTSTSSLSADNCPKKRVRVDKDTQMALHPVPLPSSPLSSSSSVSSPDTAPPAAAFSPGVHNSEEHCQHSVFPTPPPINDLSFATTDEIATQPDGQDPIGPYTCVLCSPDAPCICREIFLQQASNASNNSHHPLALQSESFHQHSVVPLDQSANARATSTSSASILDNLPAFQAPVPIRRRTGASKAIPIFPIAPIAMTSSPSKCSGDPDNCMACVNDSFGKAFCEALGHTVNSTVPCFDCPKRTNQTDEILVGGCCGDTSKCGSCGIAPIIPPTAGPETMSTDDAWRQLKSHPNVAFADLRLLAEVVARRSKCTGSRVVISPAVGSVAQDHNVGPSHHELTTASEVLFTDPHEHFRPKQRESPPRLVPQHVLIECGRRRLKEVNADGVKEALRLLDQKFAHIR